MMRTKLTPFLVVPQKSTHQILSPFKARVLGADYGVGGGSSGSGAGSGSTCIRPRRQIGLGGEIGASWVLHSRDSTANSQNEDDESYLVDVGNVRVVPTTLGLGETGSGQANRRVIAQDTQLRIAACRTPT